MSSAIANDDHGVGELTARAVGDIQNSIAVELEKKT